MKNDIVIIPGLAQSHNRNHHMWRRHIGNIWLLPFMSTTDGIWKSWRVVTFHRTVQLLSLVTLFSGDKGTLENSTGIKIGKGDWTTVLAGRSAASQILFRIAVVSTKLFGQSDIKDSGWVPGSTTPRGHFIKNPCFPLRRKCSDQDLLWWNIISKGAQTRSGSPPTAAAAFKAANTEDILWKRVGVHAAARHRKEMWLNTPPCVAVGSLAYRLCFPSV